MTICRDPASDLHGTEKGNVFFALFAAVALLGVLGITVSTFIKGPLSSSVKVTRQNVAESQMAVMAQAIVMQASPAMNCDADTFVEPVAWRIPGGVAAPSGGGLLPAALSVATTQDPWGSEYGYCVWDHGADTCGSTERLRGALTNADGQTVIALISAGPDKTFTTTCRTYAAADVNSNGTLGDPGDLPMVGKASESDDDIIFTYSYREAVGASGGLWSLKSGDEDVGTILKDLEVDGDGIFEGAGVFSSVSTNTMTARTGDFIDFMDGVLLPDAASYNPDCDGTTEGVLRRNASALEMCISGDWTSLSASGGGPGSQLGVDNAATCGGAGTAGAIRYNDALSVPQYCDGTAWRTFVTQSATVLLSVTPAVLELPVIGPCTTDCPYANGPATENITVTNIGSAPSGNITQTSYNLIVNPGSTTCSGPLAPGASCVFNVSGRTTGNYTLDDGYIEISQGGSLVARLSVHSTGSGFGCSVGGYGWGGQIVSCANASTPNFIINFPGCEGRTHEPRCTGVGADEPTFQHNFFWAYPENATTTSGAQNSANLDGYASSSQAYNYCKNLIAQGYDDWFLPSQNQLQTLLYPLRASLVMSDWYWSSTYEGSSGWAGSSFMMYNFSTNSSSYNMGDNYRRVRCLRQHNTALPAAQTDISALLYVGGYVEEYEVSGTTVGHAYATASGLPLISRPMEIRSVNTTVTVSVAGAGSPTVSVNGRTPAASTTAVNGDMIRIHVTSPAVGTQASYTLTVGSSTFTWIARTPAANTRQIFVTSTTHTGNLGGLTGADGICQARASAAGLGGTWYALLSATNAPHTDRIPWNWNRLENMAGNAVAANFNDLFDASYYDQTNIGAPINYTETGARVANGRVWTNMGYWEGSLFPFTEGFDGGRCSNWTSASSGNHSYIGLSASTSFAWGSADQVDNCNLSNRLYCMGPF